MKWDEKISIVGVIISIWLLGLNTIPGQISESAMVSSVAYWLIEFSLYSFLSIMICFLFFTKSSFGFSLLRMLSFGNAIWFGWAALTKLNMFVTGNFKYEGFKDSDLNDKIKATFFAAFLITIFYELWKLKRSQRE